MAEGKIKYDDLFDKDLIEKIAQLKAEMESLRQSATDIKGNLPRTGNKAGDLEKLNQVQRERIKLQEKLSALESEEVKANLELKQQISERLRQQKDEIKLQNSKEGSMERLSTELKRLKSEYRQLSEAERTNVNVGGKMLKNIQEQDKKIKDLDKSLGDHQRNVGNYSGSIIDAVKNMGGFNGKLNALSNGFGGLKNGLKTARAGFVSLKSALISTGIGALVVALGSIVAYFSKTTKGTRQLSAVMSGIGGVIDVLVDKLATLGEFFVNVVQNPLKYFSILKDYITDRIVPIFGSLGKIIKNAVTFNWSELGDNVDEFSENFSAVQEDWNTLAKKNTEAFKDMFNTMGKAYQENKALEESRQKLKDAERDLSVELAKNKKEYQDLLLISRDETKSFEERQAALKKANDIELSNLENTTKLAEEKVRLTKEQADWNAKNGQIQEEDLELIAEAEKELYELQATNAARRREIINRQIELSNKQASAAKAAAKEYSDFIKLLNDDMLSFEDSIMAESEKQSEKLMDNIIQGQIDASKATKEEMEKQKKEIESLVSAYQDAGMTIGQAFGEMLANQEISFGDFLKNMAIMLLDAIEKQMQMYIFQSFAQKIATKGPAGAIEAAIIAGIIKAAFTALKGTVMKFEKGEVDISGPRHSQGGIKAEIEGGESVINRGATARSRETLKLINAGLISDRDIIPAMALKGYNTNNIKIDNDFSEMVKKQDQTNELLKKFKFMSADGKKVLDIHGNRLNYV